MPDVKWIHLSTDFPNDEKIRLIERMPDGDAMVLVWIKLLCLAGKINDNGYIYITPNVGYSDEELAAVINHKLTVVQLSKATFSRYEMIEIDDNNVIFLVNFGKHQNTIGLEKIREQTRKRVANHRQRVKLKLLPQNTNSESVKEVTLPVTLRNATEKNRKEYIREEGFNIWNNVLNILKSNVTSSVFKTYFEGSVGIDLTDNEFVIGVNSEDKAVYLEKNMRGLIERSLINQGYSEIIPRFILVENAN